MRFGLVGTGPWARNVHATALAEADGVDLVAVWGRDPAKAQALADDVGATAYDDVDDVLGAVDAVAFAVPPDVQAGIAVRAAAAGCHLLLEKPVALTREDAARLEEAVDRAGVGSLVFFTARFVPEQRAWLESVRESAWEGAWGRWLGSAFPPEDPDGGSPWRRAQGGLWDVGPHVLAMVTGALGPVVRVTADAGRRDLVHLVAHHESGATSTASVTLSAPRAAGGSALAVWGAEGVSTMPTGTTPPERALALAVAELLDDVRAGRTSHPCDVRFGRHVVDLLAGAQEQLESISSNS
jgi:predicted dehydrogenase